MRNKNLLLVWILLLGMGLQMLHARDRDESYNQLIISEVRMEFGSAAHSYGYLELFNASDKTINLSDYWLQTGWVSIALDANGNPGNYGMEEGIHKIVLEGTLEPGKTFTFVQVNPNNVEDPWGDRIYPNDYCNKYIRAAADKLLFPREAGENVPGSNVLSTAGRVGLFYRGDTSDVVGEIHRDSIMVDRFWVDNVDPTERYLYPISGVIMENPPFDLGYVRKTSVSTGNTDFDQSRGTSLEDAEWLPIPRDRSYNEIEGNRYIKLFVNEHELPYTTFGVHSNVTDLVLESKNNEISIDKNNMVISLPYGVRRDSIFHNFTIGENHAWDFQLGPDTAQFFVSNGDTIEFFVLGDALKTYRFGVNVASVPADFVKARPVWFKPEPSSKDWYVNYTISDGLDEDTIGMITFSSPYDTIFKYLRIEDNANASITYVDGKERPEVLNGDVLKVSSGSNSKEYRLSVLDFAPSHEDKIGSVYLPGLELWDNKYFELTDTFVSFQSNVYDYFIDLPSDTELPPAIIATPLSSRAKVTVQRPTSLEGTDEERTAVITCIAEDDTSISVYHITFNVERENPPFYGQPFFSDLGFQWNSWSNCLNLEIFNPSADPIAMSDYVIVKHEGTSLPFNEFVSYGALGNGSMFDDPASESNKRMNNYVLRPGFWVNANEQGDFYWNFDPVFTNAELEANDEYIIMGGRGFPNNKRNLTDPNGNLLIDKVDVVVNGRGPSDEVFTAGWVQAPDYWPNRLGYPFEAKDNPSLYPYGEDMFVFSHPDWRKTPRSGDSFMLYKIKDTESGDSIKSGIKAINKNWYDDYELIDVINGASLQGNAWVVYDKVNGVDTAYRFSKSGTGYADPNFARKPWVYKGNPTDGSAFGSPSQEGEWEVFGIASDGSKALETTAETKGAVEYGESRFGKHRMVTYSHIPYITSPVYFIGKGLEGEQPIFGVLPFSTVNIFNKSIVKPDPNMTVEVKDKDGNVKTGTQRMATDDKVTTTSANGQYSVTYIVTIGVLSGDVSLTAADNSGLVVEDTVLKNVPFGETLAWLKNNVSVATYSKMLIVDDRDQIIPISKYNNDTLLHEDRIKIETLISSNHRIEVQAQDGLNVQQYTIEFANEENLVVLSDVYSVIEEYKTIDFVYGISVENFLRNLVATPGAELYVVNKMNQRREFGNLQYHDNVIVEKDGKQVRYIIKFSADESFVVDVDEVESSQFNSSYPNPTEGVITMTKLSGAHKMVVRNLAGQVVASYRVNANQMNINLEGPAGVYFVTIESENQILRTEKVVKQ